MKIVYLDSSAWVKRFWPEVGSSKVLDLLKQQPRIAMSSLGLVEVLATLTRKQRHTPIAAERQLLLLQAVSFEFSQFLEVACDRTVMARAASLATEFGLRGADAVHLASAIHCCHSLDLPFDELLLVTSDFELIAAAARLTIPSLDPSA